MIRRWLSAGVLGLCLQAGATAADAQAPTESDAVVRVAAQWLGLLDRGEYSRSWQVADPSFRRQMTAGEWARLIQSIRQPLGPVVGRSVQRVFRRVDQRRAGEDVLVVEFGARYAEAQSVLEQIVVIRNGSVWRVGGAFIQPPP